MGTIELDQATLASVQVVRRRDGSDGLILLFRGPWQDTSLLPMDVAGRLDTARPHESNLSGLQFGEVLSLARWGRVRLTLAPGESITARVEMYAARHPDAREESGIVRQRQETTEHRDLMALTPEEWDACGRAAGLTRVLRIDDPQLSLDVGL